MHQIVLLTALTATTGLFGGGRSCGTGRCGRPTTGYYAAYAPRTACQPGSPCAAPAYYPSPAYAAPQAPMAAPQVPAKMAPAPQVPANMAPAPRAAFYPSYYYPAAPTCAGGNCYRR